MAQAQVEVDNQGTIFLFRPLEESAESFMHEAFDGVWFGGALAVEHCYAPDVAEVLNEQGFLLRSA